MLKLLLQLGLELMPLLKLIVLQSIMMLLLFVLQQLQEVPRRLGPLLELLQLERL